MTNPKTPPTVDRCTMDSIGISITGEDAETITAPLAEYLSQFATPNYNPAGGMLSGSISCLKCDRPLNGMLGSFQWGLAHGEGQCSGCGWPARGRHRPTDADGEQIFDGPLEMVLQYHPDEVTTRQDHPEQEPEQCSTEDF